MTPGRGTAFLTNSGDRYKRHAARIDTVSYQKCGDFHTNLNRRSSGCDRMPPKTLPPNSDGLRGEPSARYRATPSTPAAASPNQNDQCSIEQAFAVGNRRCKAHARCPRPNNPCQDVSLHSKSGSTGTPFARSLRHALRIFYQAHNNGFQVAPAGGLNDTLVPNLERATTLLHITPALVQSSNGRCSRQGPYNEYARRKLMGLIDWAGVRARGEVNTKHGKMHLKPAEYERAS